MLLLVFVGLWMVSPVHVDEPVPGTVKTTGIVQVRRGKEDTLTQVKSLGTVKPGEVVQVEEGNVGFLFLQGGVVVRAAGPAEVAVLESRRQIDAPSVLQGLLGRGGVEAPGSTRVQSTLALEVTAGTVAVNASGVKGNASLSIRAANVFARPEGATFQVAVQPDGQVWWDTLEGSPVVGMVSGPAGSEAPVVVPEVPLGLRLVTQVPERAILSGEEYRQREASMRAMVEQLRSGSSELRAGGKEYQEFTDPSGLVYLASVEAERPAAQDPFGSEEIAEPLSAEEAVAVPGVEVRLLTDTDIQAYLPAGMTVHVLPGNTVRLTLAGVPYTVRATVAAGRLDLQGLPLGLDLSAYFTDLPAILSLETDEGVARISYLPEEAPPARQERAAEEIVEEGALPHSSPYFSSIPTPLQVSLDWNVATTNLLLIAWLALVVRVSVATSMHILGAHEAALRQHLSPVLEIWRPTADAFVAFLHRIPHLLTTVAGSVLVLLVVNGLLFAFLDGRFRPWAGRGLQVFPLMLLGTAAAGMVDPIARTYLLRRWNVGHHFGFNSANLFLGMASVSASRVLSLAPGIMLGNAGGLRVPTQKGLPLAQKSGLVVAGLAATAAVGLGAWFLTLLLPLAAGNALTASLFQLLRGPLSNFQDICLLAFTASLTKVFFSLLPVPASPGLTVAARNRVGWLVGFLLSGFLFFQLVLNRNTGITKLLQERGGLVTGLVVLSLAGTLALYVYSRMTTKKAAPAKA